MSLGKLLCVGIRGTVPGDDRLEQDLDACAKAGVGGVILFDVDLQAMRSSQQAGTTQETAKRQATRNIVDADQLRELTAYIRERLGTNIIVSVDQEGGNVARLSRHRGFQAGVSACEFAALDDSTRRREAMSQARQLADLGFNMNFAPCVDLTLEEENVIITQLGRSFGNDPQTVIECANVVLDAHASAGVAACLKHFPGHGSSRGDSHLGAVDITTTWQRDLELEPYRVLGGRPGVAVMAAHVIHRGLGGETPASLATAFIDELLRTELGFKGVVATDSIDMQAVADRYGPGEAAVAAVIAGADLVVDGFNLLARDEHPAPVLVAALQAAVKDGSIPNGTKRIDQSLERLHVLHSQIGLTG